MKRKLTNAQRITLIARSTWDKLTRAGAIDEPFDAWRHRESIATVGVRISAATSDQLDELETHFLALGGQSKKAYDNATGEPGWAKRMRWKIKNLAARLGLPEGYAANNSARQLKGILIELERRVRENETTIPHP